MREGCCVRWGGLRPPPRIGIGRYYLYILLPRFGDANERTRNHTALTLVGDVLISPFHFLSTDQFAFIPSELRKIGFVDSPWFECRHVPPLEYPNVLCIIRVVFVCRVWRIVTDMCDRNCLILMLSS